jgi:hypothetical protein
MYCSENPLSCLPNLPNELKYLVCKNCNITRVLSFPETLCYVNIRYNPLRTIGLLPSNMIDIKLEETKIYEIIGPIKNPVNSTVVNVINSRLTVLNAFRELYYYIKFKKKLRDWLWLKVRLPRIERMNHPTILRNALENVENDEEFEETIKNFGK